MSITEDQLEKIQLLNGKYEQFIEEGYPYENQIILLMASYCGDNPECTEFRPCLDCLQMSNIAILENGEVTAICGYDYIQNVKLEK